MTIISLITDFGLNDPYVAQMKAALLRINPDVVIVDLTHRVEKYNIMMGAIILASNTKYFPKKTIHIGVIDPGVGGTRKPIIVETERNLFVGPDNGLLIPAAEQEGIRQIFEIINKKYQTMAVKLNNIKPFFSKEF